MPDNQTTNQNDDKKIDQAVNQNESVEVTTTITEKAKSLPWKKIGICSLGVIVVGAGAIFAYNGLMDKVAEVATEAAKTVSEKASEAV